MKITINEIARLAGVSKSTVSKALNNYSGEVSGEVRNRIAEIVKNKNYKPNMTARSLRTKKTNTIGLVIPLPTANVITNPYFIETILSVEKTARERGYHLIFSTFDNREKEDVVLSSMFDKSKVDGFLIMGAPVDDEYIEKLDTGEVKVVCVGRYYGLNKIKFVDINNRESAYEAVKYLLSLGHKKIAFIGGSSKFHNRRDRELGYKTALEEEGVAINKSYLKEIDLSEASGEFAMQELLNLKERPTAVLTHNDQSAAGVMRAATKNGLSIPKDLSVISFSSGTKLAETNPLLTSIRIPVDKISSGAANMLLDYIENKVPENNIELKAELVVRGTTAASAAIKQ